MNQDYKVVILAISEQSSFPGQFTIDLCGKPLLQHVYEQASRSAASDVIIATDSTRVGMQAEDFGATVCMIVDEELRGINHISEVADKLGWGDETVVVNIPVDSPMIDALLIDQLAQNLLAKEDFECTTLYSLSAPELAASEEVIKLITDINGGVLYMSRMLIPHQLTEAYPVEQYQTSIGVAAYRAGLLRVYRKLPSSELDRLEDIEELKLLYNGIRIHAAQAEHQIGPRIQSEEDIENVEQRLADFR